MENKQEYIKKLLIYGCMLLAGLILVIVSMLEQVRGSKLSQLLTAVGAGLMFGGYVSALKLVRAKKAAEQADKQDKE